MERPADDALLGPTFQCLVGDQLKRLKFGDRFWFEEGGQLNSFTEGKASQAGQRQPHEMSLFKAVHLHAGIRTGAGGSEGRAG